MEYVSDELLNNLLISCADIFDFFSTVMPMSYRRSLVGLMVANLVMVCAYEYFIVNRTWSKANKAKKEDNVGTGAVVKDIESS